MENQPHTESPDFLKLKELEKRFSSEKNIYDEAFKQLLTSTEAANTPKLIVQIKGVYRSLKEIKEEYKSVFEKVKKEHPEKTLKLVAPETLKLPSRELPRQYKPIPIVLLTSTLVTFIVISVRFFGSLQSLELFFYDRFIRSQVPELDKRVLVIEVNEEDYQKQKERDGKEPLDKASLSNQTLSLLLTKLKCFEPIAVGLDIQRDQNLDEQLTLELLNIESDRKDEQHQELIKKSICDRNLGSQLDLYLQNLNSDNQEKEQRRELLEISYKNLNEFFATGYLNDNSSSRDENDKDFTGHLFAICKADDDQTKNSSSFSPPPAIPLSKIPERVGFADFPSVDGDGNTLRRNLLAFKHSSAKCTGVTEAEKNAKANDKYPTYTSFSLLIANHYLKKENIAELTRLRSGQSYFSEAPYNQEEYCDNLQFSNGVELSNFQPVTGGYQGYSSDAGIEGHFGGCQILLKYRGYDVDNPSKTFKTFSVEKVLNMPHNDINKEYKNRIILIGVTRYGGGNDYWLTPHGEIPGVIVQAHMISQILDAVILDRKEQPIRSLIQVLPEWQGFEVGEWGLIFVFSMIGGFLGVAPLMEESLHRFARQMREPHIFLILLTVLSSIYYWFSAFIFASSISLWLPFFPCILALWSTSGLVVLITRSLGLIAEKDLESLLEESNQND